MCTNPDPTERDVITVIVNKKSTVDLSKKTSNTKYFDSKGTFFDWDSNYHPQTIEIDLINPINTKYFRITKCNFCRERRIFEIHVECVRQSEQKLDYTYKNAVSEGFDLPPKDDNKCVTVNFLIYNSDPCVPEQYYIICGNQGSGLVYPKTEVGDDCEDENLSDDHSFIGGPQPETKKGNILQGGN